MPDEFGSHRSSTKGVSGHISYILFCALYCVCCIKFINLVNVKIHHISQFLFIFLTVQLYEGLLEVKIKYYLLINELAVIKM